MALHSVEWYFWAWKTAFLMRLWKNKFNFDNYIVFTNVQFNSNILRNWVHFEDAQIFDVIKVVNYLNDLDRLDNYLDIKGISFKPLKRSSLTKMIILFDESTSLLNNRGKQTDIPLVIHTYLTQTRKNNLDIYLCGSDSSQNEKSFRRHVDLTFLATPLSKRLPILKDFTIVKWQKKDSDGKIIEEQYVWKDENWDYVKKVRPLQWHFEWFWKVPLFNLYNDLYKNIKDPNKYDFDKSIIQKVLDLDLKQTNKFKNKLVKIKKEKKG